MTNVAWTYDSGKGTASLSDKELPIDYYCDEYAGCPCDRYIRHLDYTRYVTGNKYIKQFDFYVQYSFVGWADYLYYGTKVSPTSSIQALLWPVWKSITFSASDSMQSIGAMFRMVTDDTYPGCGDGFIINGARVCCGTANAGRTILPNAQRTSGILLGKNDVVYATTDPYCGSRDQSIAVWSGGGLSADVYARCNADPTITVFDYHSYSVNNSIFIHIPSSCTCVGKWHVVIHSDSGAGWFNVVPTSHYPIQHRVITAGTDFIATSTYMQSLIAALKKADKYFYGVTEVTPYIERIDLYNEGSCNNCGGHRCDLCFTSNSSCDRSYFDENRVVMCPSAHQNHRTIAHEWGHMFGGLPDEYNPKAPHYSRCGHSLMSANYESQNNFCYSYDHGQDRRSDQDPPPNPSAWSRLMSSGRAPSDTVLGVTPDNYNYITFDFGIKLGLIILK